MTKIHIEPYWSEVKPSESYVYLHIRISDGLIYHVGKGTKERGWDVWSRSDWWKWVARKHGCRVEIYRDGMHELCALSLEKILIAKYRSLGHPLTNMTDGGEGVVGLAMPFRKPVCNSLGERFPYVMDAARVFRERGEFKATSGEISAAASGKRNSAFGCSWWYEGQNPKDYVDRRVRQGITVGKSVVSSDGLAFDSLSEAARHLRENGYPKAKAYNISLAARGDMDYAYGRSWVFNVEDTEEEI